MLLVLDLLCINLKIRKKYYISLQMTRSSFITTVVVSIMNLSFDIISRKKGRTFML